MHCPVFSSRASLRVWLPLLPAFAFVGSAAPAQQKVSFEEQIWPLLDRSCVKCHKAPFEENGKTVKPKAGLRLDGAWAILQGGDDGAVLVKGKAEGSSLYTRTILPKDDEDVMPPDGKAEALTPTEQELLKKWIDEGADFGAWQGSLAGKPKELSNTGDKIPAAESQELYAKLSEGLEVPREAQWKTITAAGGRVLPLAVGSPLVSVDFRLVGKDADDADLAAISAVGPHIADLNASDTAITDASLAVIGKLERLVRLDLHGTRIGDAELGALGGLKNLRYLNLYGTQVSDAGLEKLKGLGSLTHVYLWESKVTDSGAKALAKALPKAKVSFK